MKLYHLSPKRLKTLDPTKSQGAFKRVWLATTLTIDEIADHIASHHDTTKDKLWLHEVDIDAAIDLTYYKQGIYVTYDYVTVSRVRKYQ